MVSVVQIQTEGKVRKVVVVFDR